MKNVLIKGMGGSPGIGSGEVELFDGSVAENKIVVVDRITPDIAPLLKNVSGVIADKGGITSHGVHILREFGIPCVVGTGFGSKILREGQVVTVDGWSGEVFEGIIEIKAVDVKEVYGTQTRIYASIEDPEIAKKVSELFDGVGSLRSNYIILKSKKHPRKWIEEGKEKHLEDLIYEGTKIVLDAFNTKPVWYKTLDVPTDEFRRLEGGEDEPYERNPLLGWRGIKRELMDRRLLDIELNAISRLLKEGYSNLYIKIPFVRDVREYKELLQILQDYDLENARVGISVETPAVALSIENFIVLGIDFISIGINDLAMCFLGVGRDNERVADLFRDDHPAILKILEELILKCRDSKIKTCIAGGISDNLLISLVGKIDIICTDPVNVLEMRKKIYMLENKKGKYKNH